METKKTDKTSEHEARSNLWSMLPSQMHTVYGDLSTTMEVHCSATICRHKKRVKFALAVMLLLFFSSTPFSLYALTLDYRYTFLAENNVEASVEVIENLNSLFAHQ